MASNKPVYGWSEASAADMKKIPLPDKYDYAKQELTQPVTEGNRFLCRECKKFKSPPQFSNKQLNEYRFKVQMRQRVTPISSQLRCRNCTGEQTQELLCTGPCDMWKGLEEFSKTQRRRPENAWCESCTQWKEANEPGVTPMPPPNNLLSPDEDDELVENEAGFGAYTSSDIGGEIYSDDEVIRHSLASTSIADGCGPRPIGMDSKALDFMTQSTVLPGHSIRPKNTRNVQRSQSSLSNPYEARSDFTSDGDSSGSESRSKKDITKGKIEKNSSDDIWPAANRNKQKPGIPYNAWDNVGKMHEQYRALSQSSALSGMSGSLTSPASESASLKPLGGWAKVNAYHQDRQPVLSGQTGAWPKAALATRNPAPQFPALSRPVKQNIYDDDDDSSDEM